MENKISIISLIPVRSGSKSIPHKNIYEFEGKPLMAHTIEQSLNSKFIQKTYVSTDSYEYKNIAEQYGALAPFLRPKEISKDLSTDLEVFVHFLEWMSKNNLPLPDLIVHLRATYPTRKVEDIDFAIEKFIENFDKFDSLRSVVIAPITPYKMWRIEENELFALLTDEQIKEPYNEPRQNLPEVYWQNACIDIIRPSVILRQNSMTGKKILPFLMNKDEIHDIDELIDLDKIKLKKDNLC